MKEYQQRMLDELAQVNSKHNELKEFAGSDEYEQLSLEDKLCFHKKMSSLVLYKYATRRRIEKF